MRRLRRGAHHSAHNSSNRILSRTLADMKENNEDSTLTEVNPLIVIAAVLLAIILIAKMLKQGTKLPGIKSLSQKKELPGE